MDSLSEAPKSHVAAVFWLAGYAITLEYHHNGDALSHAIFAALCDDGGHHSATAFDHIASSSATCLPVAFA